jgi:hypothetical protein
MRRMLTVYQFLVCGGQLKFTRWLPPVLFKQWVDVVEKAFKFQFHDIDDTVKWKWGGAIQLDPCMTISPEMMKAAHFHTYGKQKFHIKSRSLPGS